MEPQNKTAIKPQLLAIYDRETGELLYKKEIIDVPVNRVEPKQDEKQDETNVPKSQINGFLTLFFGVAVLCVVALAFAVLVVPFLCVLALAYAMHKVWQSNRIAARRNFDPTIYQDAARSKACPTLHNSAPRVSVNVNVEVQ